MDLLRRFLNCKNPIHSFRTVPPYANENNAAVSSTLLLLDDRVPALQRDTNTGLVPFLSLPEARASFGHRSASAAHEIVACERKVTLEEFTVVAAAPWSFSASLTSFAATHDHILSSCPAGRSTIPCSETKINETPERQVGNERRTAVGFPSHGAITATLTRRLDSSQRKRCVNFLCLLHPNPLLLRQSAQQPDTETGEQLKTQRTWEEEHDQSPKEDHDGRACRVGHLPGSKCRCCCCCSACAPYRPDLATYIHQQA